MLFSVLPPTTFNFFCISHAFSLQLLPKANHLNEWFIHFDFFSIARLTISAMVNKKITFVSWGFSSLLTNIEYYSTNHTEHEDVLWCHGNSWCTLYISSNDSIHSTNRLPSNWINFYLNEWMNWNFNDFLDEHIVNTNQIVPEIQIHVNQNNCLSNLTSVWSITNHSD